MGMTLNGQPQFYSTTTLQHYNSTALQLYNSTEYNSTARQLYNSTTLQLYSSTILQLYNSTAVQLYSTTALQLYNSTTLQLYNSTAPPQLDCQKCVNLELRLRLISKSNNLAKNIVLCDGVWKTTWLHETYTDLFLVKGYALFKKGYRN